MREPLRDKTRLEHMMEAIVRLQTYAGHLSQEELLVMGTGTWVWVPVFMAIFYERTRSHNGRDGECKRWIGSSGLLAPQKNQTKS